EARQSGDERSGGYAGFGWLWARVRRIEAGRGAAAGLRRAARRRLRELLHPAVLLGRRQARRASADWLGVQREKGARASGAEAGAGRGPEGAARTPSGRPCWSESGTAA